MSAVVLDSSTALQLLLPDSEADRSRFLVLMASIEDGSRLAHVPMIFMNEVAAGCARAVRGGRATKAEAEAFFHLLSAVKLNLDMEILPPDAWYARAMQMHCQVADGAYLALARRLGAELACDAIRRRRRLRTSPFGTTPGQSARGLVMALFDRSDIVRVRLDPVQGHVMRGDARGVAAIEAALAGRRTEAVVSVRGAQLRHRLSHADRRLAAAHAARVCRGWW